MKRYCLGFMFSLDSQLVVLIQKRKPEWQAGLLNGVGGKVEEGEDPIDAMVREFEEETSVKTGRGQWADAGFIAGPDYTIFLYFTYDHRAEQVQSTTEEPVKVVPVNMLPLLKTIPNLGWIIPYLLDAERSRATELSVTYAA